MNVLKGNFQALKVIQKNVFQLAGVLRKMCRYKQEISYVQANNYYRVIFLSAIYNKKRKRNAGNRVIKCCNKSTKINTHHTHTH